MLPKSIEDDLTKLSPVEFEQKRNGGNNIQDVPNATGEDSLINSMPLWRFFDEGPIAVTKSNRFSYVPAHYHQFIEMNYVYMGTSIQHIDDTRIKLLPGQLILMDRSVLQRIDYSNQNDILLNILIKDDVEIQRLLDGVLNNSSLLSKFLFNICQKDVSHDNYLIFDLTKDPATQMIVESLIANSLHNKGDNNQVIFNLMLSLLIKLPPLLKYKKLRFIAPTNDPLYEIISFINQNYSTITLEELSEHFGYHPNYLGAKIKENLGVTFKQIIQLRRLNVACNLLQRTNWSIQRISEYLGFENHSSLFRLFKKEMQVTPSEYRKKVFRPLDIDQNKQN